MYLTFRRTQLNELDQCFAMIRDRHLYNPEQKVELVNLWASVLRGGSGESAVVLDHNRPRRHQLVGFGLAVFVADWFADQVAAMPPFLGLRLLELERHNRSPIQNREEAASANLGKGLNVFSLHMGWAEDRLTPLEVKEVQHSLAEAFVFLYRGYKLRTVFHEFYGKEELALLPGLGGQLWSDYRWFFQAHPELEPSQERWPYLAGVTPEVAQQTVATVSFSLFTSPEPRYGFSQREQEVLHHALLGKTDEAIAQELGISLSAVKKLWKSVYERVAARDPMLLLPSAPWPTDPEKRGREKRRFVLNHLRFHPEELRPRAGKKYRQRV